LGKTMNDRAVDRLKNAKFKDVILDETFGQICVQ
jgi:hypothetical protein